MGKTGTQNMYNTVTLRRAYKLSVWGTNVHKRHIF